MTRTGKKSQMSSNFGQIRPLTLELLSLERIKNEDPIAFHFYQIFVKLAGNQDRHKISDEFEFRPDPTIDLGVTFP